MKYPEFFVIEITNRCNITCPACPWHTCMRRSIKDMSFLEFKLIIKKILPYAKTVCLYLMGEPFLNTELKQIIEYLKSNDIRVIISSNGMLIQENIDWIINGDIDYLQIALDGYTKETHEKYRIGSNFDIIIAGLELLSSYKDTNLKNTEIVIQTLINKYNENEIRMIENYAKSLGFTYHTKKMHYGRTEDLRIKNSSKFQPSDEKNIRRIGKSFYCLDIPCPELEKAVILSNGTVVACCLDYDGKTDFGNIFIDSFEKIWSGKKRVDFINSYHNKKNLFCNECDMIYST